MLLKIAKLAMPEYIKNKKLDDLFGLTAGAFQTEAPELRGLSFSERLAKYACFTRDQAERIITLEDPTERRNRLETVEGRLYLRALQFGRSLRKGLRIKTWEQAVEALELIYRTMGIDFHYEKNGTSRRDRRGGFTVSACYFSGYYSAEICGLISSLDRGLAEGLSEGGRLSFDQRITEGSSCCRGYFSNEKRDESQGAFK